MKLPPSSRHFSLRLLLGAALAALAVSPLAVTAANSPQNEKILEATDPFEGLTETALTGNAGKIATAFKATQQARTATRALLPAASTARYDEQFAALDTAQAKHDNLAVSLAAAELYKVLVSSLDSAALEVPKEVGLLDYVGFRISALLKAPSIDWPAIAATTKEANAYWATVRDRVSDTKLRTQMDAAQKGLTTAAQSRNTALAQTSVKSDLDLVDDLEKHFAKK